MTLGRDDINQTYKDKLSTQQYGEKETIDGVELVALPHFTDDGGAFIEVARLTEGKLDWIPDAAVAQVSYSEMLPGVVKAFHLHLAQEDVWFVPPSSRMLVGLLDARAASPTSGQTMRLVLGAGKAQLIRIPVGVAHGVKNLDRKTGFVFYFVSQQFDKDQPDEQRLPWDTLGAEFWETTKG